MVVPNIAVANHPTTVFRWKTDRCNDEDVPDAPLRVIRLRDDALFATAANRHNRVFLGADFGSLKKDCRSIYESREDPDPTAYDYRTWLMSFWTNDGVHIVALAHNEFQAARLGQCRYAVPAKCNYDSITTLLSDDSGRSFRRLSRKPIAAPRAPPDPSLGHIRGFLHPSNIVRWHDYYYAVIQAAADRKQLGGACLFRTTDPFDPSKWEYLTNGGFRRSAARAPYPVQLPPCERLRKLSGIVWSIAKHENSDTLIATLIIGTRDPERSAVAISISKDFVTWSTPTPILIFAAPWDAGCAAATYSYPSLIDPHSASRNFDTIGDTAALFMVRMNMTGCKMTLDRDLIRYNVKIDWRGDR